MKQRVTHVMKATFLLAILFLIPVTGKAQSLTLTATNAQAHSYNSATYTHTVTVPFFETSLTGNFKITKDGFFSCTSPSFRTMQVNNYNSGAYLGSNGTTGTNYVNLNVTSLPIGTTNLKVYFGCSGSTPSSIIVKIIVNKLPDPQLNVTITPYCKKDQNNLYTNYFGYNVSGTVINKQGLQFRVVPDDNTACPTMPRVEPFSLFNINTTTNAFAPGSSFYDCNKSTGYTVVLEYVYTRVGTNTPFVYTFDDNTYGWHNHRWVKKITTCMNILEHEDPKFELRSSSTEGEEDRFTVYPNPTDGSIQLKAKGYEQKIKSIKVFDANYVPLFQTKTNTTGKMDLSALKRGMYIISIETEEGVFTEKVFRN